MTFLCARLHKAKQHWRLGVSLIFFSYASIALRFGLIQWAKHEGHDPTDPILYHELWANILSAWWLGLLHGCRGTELAKRYRALHLGMAYGFVGSFASWQLSMSLALIRVAVPFRLYLLGLATTLSLGVMAFYVGVHMMLLWCWAMLILRPIERLAFLRRTAPVRTQDVELSQPREEIPRDDKAAAESLTTTLPPEEAAAERAKATNEDDLERGSIVLYHILLVGVEAGTTAFVVCLFAAPDWKGLWFSFLMAPIACWLRYWLSLYNTRFPYPIFTLAVNFIGTMILTLAVIAHMALENDRYPDTKGDRAWNDPALYLLPAVAVGFAGSFTTFSTFVAEIASLSLLKTYVYGLGTLLLLQVPLLLVNGIYYWAS